MAFSVFWFSIITVCRHSRPHSLAVSSLFRHSLLCSLGVVTRVLSCHSVFGVRLFALSSVTCHLSISRVVTGGIYMSLTKRHNFVRQLRLCHCISPQCRHSLPSLCRQSRLCRVITRYLGRVVTHCLGRVVTLCLRCCVITCSLGRVITRNSLASLCRHLLPWPCRHSLLSVQSLAAFAVFCLRCVVTRCLGRASPAAFAVSSLASLAVSPLALAVFALASPLTSPCRHSLPLLSMLCCHSLSSPCRRLSIRTLIRFSTVSTLCCVSPCLTRFPRWWWWYVSTLVETLLESTPVGGLRMRSESLISNILT